MRVFVTGAGGHIASAVIPELLRHGHTVTGLARSSSSADAVSALGATVVRGSLTDTDVLAASASAADAVVHLAYDHALIAEGRLGEAAEFDTHVVRAFGDALAGTGKTFVGIGGIMPESMLSMNPRFAIAHTIMALNDQGVRSLMIAIPPVVHGPRDRHGFIPTLIEVAERTGVSAYLNEGTNTWPAVHAHDLAVLYRLAVEDAPARAQLVGAAEAGTEVRAIAAEIGARLGVPVRSLTAEEAVPHFSGFPFIGYDVTMSAEETRRALGWKPVEPTLVEDLSISPYFSRS